MTKFAAVAAPALMLLYGICRWIDGFDGDRNNGPAWDIGHVAFFAAMVLFGVLVVGLRGWAPRPRALMDTAVAAALFGVGCFLWVIVGDLSEAFQQAAPLPTLLEGGGPLLFQVGMMIVLIRLVVARAVPFWTPPLVLLGFGAIAYSLDLLPFAAILVGIGLLPIALPKRRTGVVAASG